jgi:ABC-type uncharacterized transport system permease subunit
VISGSLLFSVAAMGALLPAAAVRFRAADHRDALFWVVLALAVVVPTGWAIALLGGEWRTSFAVSLWVTIAATMALFFAVAALTRSAWRLTPLLVPYLVVLGLLATIWQHAPAPRLSGEVPLGWLEAHIFFAVATYGLVTVAAIAALAVMIQERALKAKRPTGLSRRLPAVSEAETIEVRLLAISEIVLGAGLLSGMAAQYFTTGALLAFNHKTIFSIAAFIMIGLLVVLYHRTGLRGRRSARAVLVAYLLLTLAYPGVKFVAGVLLS